MDSLKRKRSNKEIVGISKQSEHELQQALDFAEGILATTPSPF
jgi:hypothetical protein